MEEQGCTHVLGGMASARRRGGQKEGSDEAHPDEDVAQVACRGIREMVRQGRGAAAGADRGGAQEGHHGENRHENATCHAGGGA